MSTAVRFYLAEQVPITLNRTNGRRTSYDTTTSTTSAISSDMPITKIQLVDPQQEILHNQLCNEVASVFQNRKLRVSFHTSTTVQTKQQFVFTTRYHSLGLNAGNHAPPKEIKNKQTKFEVLFVNHANTKSKKEKIKNTFDKSCILEAELFGFHQTEDFNLNDPVFEESERITTREMQLTLSSEGDAQFIDASYNSAIENVLQTGHTTLHGKLNLVLIAKTKETILSLPKTTQHGNMVINKRILDEELATDLVILPNNGMVVKCHRSFLVAHSDVFRTMLSTDMEEAKTRRIEIPDMSEMGVRAFLAYLYYWDESQAHKNSAVAVELLKAGHKYNVGSLELTMRSLLLMKHESWYEVDVAMELYTFLQNFDGDWEPLKMKAAMMLKGYLPL